MSATGTKDIHTTVEAFNRIVEQENPIAEWMGIRAEEIGHGTARLRVPFDPRLLRPGGVVNGPVLMSIADYAMYAAVMGADPRGKGSVTSNMNMYFLRGSSERDLIAEARVVKGGRRLAVCEVWVHAEGEDAPVAQVSGTYIYAARG